MDKIVLCRKVSEEFHRIPTKEQVKGIHSALNRLLTIYTELFDISKMTKSISNYLDEFSKRLRDIYGDGVCGYEKWGEFGWTYCPSLNNDMFKVAPATVEEANKTMEQYLSHEEIEKMRYALEVSEADKDEIDEAFQCFCEGKYKACSLLLFGIIDKHLYGFGFEKQHRGKTRIQIGVGAANKLDETVCYDYTVYVMLANILSAIKKVFQDGDDFKKDMGIINRNYISHGQCRRKISRLECFQIWCLTYSTCVYIDVLRQCNADYEKEQKMQEVKQ